MGAVPLVHVVEMQGLVHGVLEGDLGDHPAVGRAHVPDVELVFSEPALVLPPGVQTFRVPVADPFALATGGACRHRRQGQDGGGQYEGRQQRCGGSCPCARAAPGGTGAGCRSEVKEVGREPDRFRGHMPPSTAVNTWVIVGRKPGAPLTDLQHPWRRIRARADLDDVRIHDLRHSCASWRANTLFLLLLFFSRKIRNHIVT